MMVIVNPNEDCGVHVAGPAHVQVHMHNMLAWLACLLVRFHALTQPNNGDTA